MGTVTVQVSVLFPSLVVTVIVAVPAATAVTTLFENVFHIKRSFKTLLAIHHADHARARGLGGAKAQRREKRCQSPVYR
jgi:hypothetical protein